MLIRSSINSMLMLWKRGDTVFSQLPIEMILAIKHLPTPDNDFLEALHHTVFGELEALKAKLEEAKPDKKDLMRLLLQAADVMTPGGKLIKGVTLLECALGAGDIEMAEMIKSYFDEFEGGKKEFERQRDRYRSCIEAIATQQHDYDINWLIEIIKMSSQKDVAAELASGDQFDPTYQSPLRDAMNQFRRDMLDPKRRIISTPRMHCNYKNFEHVDEVIHREYGNLKYGKHRLVSCQIYGFMQLIDLPAYDRFEHAQYEPDVRIASIAGPIKRSFDYKDPNELGNTFPMFSEGLLLSHSGVGFDSYVSINNAGPMLTGGRPYKDSGRTLDGVCFKNCLDHKIHMALSFLRGNSQQPDHHREDDWCSDYVFLPGMSC